MRYVLCWRIVIFLLALSLLLIPAFQFWQQHPQVLLGSAGLSAFVYAYWWVFVMIGLATAFLAGAVLMLLDKGLPLWARILCVILSFPLPVLPFYWVIRIELPLWRARRAQLA
jgi:hypothetical protein